MKTRILGIFALGILCALVLAVASCGGKSETEIEQDLSAEMLVAGACSSAEDAWEDTHDFTAIAEADLENLNPQVDFVTTSDSTLAQDPNNGSVSAAAGQVYYYSEAPTSCLISTQSESGTTFAVYKERHPSQESGLKVSYTRWYENGVEIKTR